MNRQSFPELLDSLCLTFSYFADTRLHHVSSSNLPVKSFGARFAFFNTNKKSDQMLSTTLSV